MMSSDNFVSNNFIGNFVGMKAFENELLANSETFTSQGAPIVVLTNLKDSNETRILDTKEPIRFGRQISTKNPPLSSNGIFTNIVLSRSHAEIWSDETGKVYIKDMKSSNGTYVNGNRLSEEGHESESFELHNNDIVDFGIDIYDDEEATLLFEKVAMHVQIIPATERSIVENLIHSVPTIYPSSSTAFDLSTTQIMSSNDEVPSGQVGQTESDSPNIHDDLNGIRAQLDEQIKIMQEEYKYLVNSFSSQAMEKISQLQQQIDILSRQDANGLSTLQEQTNKLSLELKSFQLSTNEQIDHQEKLFNISLDELFKSQSEKMSELEQKVAYLCNKDEENDVSFATMDQVQAALSDFRQHVTHSQVDNQSITSINIELEPRIRETETNISILREKSNFLDELLSRLQPEFNQSLTRVSFLEEQVENFLSESRSGNKNLDTNSFLLEISELQREVNMLHTKYGSLEEHFAQKEQILKDASAIEKEALKGELVFFQSRISEDMRRLKDELESRIPMQDTSSLLSLFHEKCQKYDDTFNGYELKLQDYEQQFQSCEEKIRSYKENFDRCEEQLRDYQDQLDDYESKFVLYEEKMRECGKKVDDVSEVIDTHEGVFPNLQEKLQSYEQKIENVTSIAKGMVDDVLSRNNVIDAMQVKFLDIQEKFNEKKMPSIQLNSNTKTKILGSFLKNVFLVMACSLLVLLFLKEDSSNKFIKFLESFCGIPNQIMPQ